MGSLQDSANMRASLVFIFSIITTLAGKHLLIEKADDIQEPGMNASASDYGYEDLLALDEIPDKSVKELMEDKECFPHDWKRTACPPLFDVQIIHQKSDTTVQKGAYNEYYKKCYTFRDNPICFQATKLKMGWVSGQ